MGCQTMKKKLYINSGKTILIPSRMYKKSELEDMDITHVDERIFFNKVQPQGSIEQVNEEIRAKMAIINYFDFSDTPFSIKILKDKVKEQLINDGDFIFLPYFKNETEFDVRKKLDLAAELRTKTDKEIILEISYKSTISDEELKNKENNFDILAIFYGTYFGRLPSFVKLAERILTVKILTGKNIFCTGVPFMFAGNGNDTTSYLQPLWDLICEGWVKNWKRGGGQKEIKLIDFKDYKNKNYQGWLEAGHRPNELIININSTTYSLFSKNIESEGLRDLYSQSLIDETLTEVQNSLTPIDAEKYIMTKIRPVYQSYIFNLYREKVLQQEIRTSEWISQFSNEDRKLIENKFRSTIFNPSLMVEKIKEIKNLKQEQEKITTNQVINIIEKFPIGV